MGVHPASWRRRPRALAALLALGLGAGLAPAGAHAGTSGGPTIQVAVARLVATRKAAPAYRVDVAYPRLSGELPGLGSVNAGLASFARSSVARFEREVAKAGPPPRSMPAAAAVAQLLGVVTTGVVTDRLVGFTFSVYDYPAGAAHGDTVVSTLTFDASTGAQLALSQLFRAGSPWLQELSSQSRSRLRKLLGASTSPSMLDPGTTPKASNFSAWSPTPWGLRLTFGNYQVAPYAAGTPSVLIPYAALSKVLAPGGPASEAAATGPVEMPLLPATSAPVRSECEAPVTGSSEVPRPLQCPGGQLNVAAWNAYAQDDISVLGAGQDASSAEVRARLCADLARIDAPAYLLGAYQLATAYYGWSFSPSPASGFPRSCKGGS